MNKATHDILCLHDSVTILRYYLKHSGKKNMIQANGKTGRIYYSRLLDRRRLSSHAFEIELERPGTFHFKPGQYIRFIRGDEERDYTLISALSDLKLALCVYKARDEGFASELASAEIGTRFPFTGPHGYFVFRDSSRPAVFVATGTGIAPFLSLGRSGITPFALFHGARTCKEFYYARYFRSITKSYVPCLSGKGEGDATCPDALPGRVTDHLVEKLPRGTYDFYLCGRREMIRDVTLQVDEYFPTSMVYTETFF